MRAGDSFRPVRGLLLFDHDSPAFAQMAALTGPTLSW